MHPRYNSRCPMTNSHRTWTAAVFAVVLALSATAWTADWTQPATQLARQIGALTGPTAASISYRNQSTLTSDQFQSARRALESQLRSGNVRLVSSNAAAEIRVTFSENAQGFVWVAEVQKGPDVSVTMVSADRATAVVGPVRTPAMELRKTLLWSQPAQILDVAVIDPMMFVLDSEAVTLYRRSGAVWQPEQSMAIVRENAWPRDLRGRLWAAHTSEMLFRAYLPGKICTSNGSSPLNMTCRAGDDPWPLSPNQSAFYAPARNFFTGVLAPPLGKQGSVTPFYSAAVLPRGKWIFARSDGTVHVQDPQIDTPLRNARWGSDIAALNSGCGSGSQVLATGTDSSTPDAVHVLDVSDRDATEIAPAIELPGPVTALWTTFEGKTAVAVVHNLKTDRYDAFELAIACNQ